MTPETVAVWGARKGPAALYSMGSVSPAEIAEHVSVKRMAGSRAVILITAVRRLASSTDACMRLFSGRPVVGSAVAVLLIADTMSSATAPKFLFAGKSGLWISTPLTVVTRDILGT